MPLRAVAYFRGKLMKGGVVILDAIEGELYPRDSQGGIILTRLLRGAAGNISIRPRGTASRSDYADAPHSGLRSISGLSSSSIR